MNTADLLAGIPALAGAEPVTRVTLPARLDYTYTPGAAQSRFLTALTERRLLDGAHVGLHARVGGIPHDQVHVGQRVEPVWRDPAARSDQPSLAAISHFRPTGDPDADPESYRRWM
jgi:hypothetical protein